LPPVTTQTTAGATIVTAAFTTTSAPMCVVDMAALSNNFPSLSPGDYIGYVEKDGVPGKTSIEEEFVLGDVLDQGITLHVSCNNCTCDDASILSCSDEECDVDCTWAAWTTWSPCPVTCDGGAQTRTRSIETPSNGNGRSCETDPFFETRPCNEDSCPGEWSTWSPWSNCTAGCGQGSITRSRTCDGGPCDGDNLESEICTGRCPDEVCTDMNAEWLTDCIERPTCPQTCDHARGTSAECVEPESCVPGCYCKPGFMLEDDSCVEQSECKCDYEAMRLPPGGEITNQEECLVCTCVNAVMECMEADECNVDCGYGDWELWGECDKACEDGVQTRTREGELPPAQGTGAVCDPALLTETRPCNNGPCQVCTDETGANYTVGETISEDTCYKVFCNELLQIVNETIANELCQPPPPEDEYCQLSTVNEVIRLTDEAGNICVSDAEVELSVCEGSCPGSDKSPLQFKNEAGGVHAFTCECCQGIPEGTRTETVNCAGTPREVNILVYSQCHCAECKGSEPTGAQPTK